MNPNNKPVTFKEFMSVYESLFNVSDTSNIPTKFMVDEIENKFRINYNLLENVINRKGTSGVKGLDFGCDLAYSCVIGQSFGLDIVGIDIEEYDHDQSVSLESLYNTFHTRERNMRNPYMDVLNNMKKRGYNTECFNTNVFPWKQFEDNEFDFVIAVWSLLKNFVTNGKTEHELKKVLENRIREIIRITKKNGVWYIGPHSHYVELLKMKPFLDNIKGIDIVWVSDKEMYVACDSYLEKNNIRDISKNPLVSIVIPLYNYEKYIYDCLKSCINQTYKNIEIIIIDDCSTDGSVDVVNEFIEDSNDDRIKLLRCSSNSGGNSVAKNTGIIKSKGALIAHLDADDMLTKDSIECRVEEFLKDENVDFVHGLCYDFYDNKSYEWCNEHIDLLESNLNSKTERIDYNIKNKKDNEKKKEERRKQIHAQGVMLKKKMYVKYGLYEEKLRARGDKEMWIRLEDIVGINIVKIDKKVAFYRRHDKSMIHKRKRNPEYQEELKRILDKCVNMRRVDGITKMNTRFIDFDPDTEGSVFSVNSAMKVCTLRNNGISGKEVFLKKLLEEFKNHNISVTNNYSCKHDIFLYMPTALERISINTISSLPSKKIVRIDGLGMNETANGAIVSSGGSIVFRSLHNADGIIYQSEFSEKMVNKHLGKFYKKSKVIHNGSPLDYYDVENVEKEYKYNFMCLARWRSIKRLQDIIESFLLADIEDSCLFVIGDVNNRHVSIDRMRYKGIKNIKFIGKVDNEELGKYFTMCDANIHLCGTDSCPNSVIESLTSGCPVISSNNGGTPELVSLAGGIICDIDDENDPYPSFSDSTPEIDISKVAEAIIRSTKEKIIVDGSCFDMKIIAKQYLDFFQEVLSE